MREEIIRALRLIEPTDRLVRIKSWVPMWDGQYLAWPVMVVDSKWGQRFTQAPCWDRTRLKFLFGERKGKE